MVQPKRHKGSEAAPGAGGPGQVKSLARGLVLLEHLAESERGATLTDLAQQVALPASTTHRLLCTLQQARFVSQDNETGLWRIGMRAFVVGHSFLKNRDFVAESRPIMRHLMERSGESVNLAVLDDGAVVFVSQVECSQMMRMLAKIGSRAPIHASAVGKAILAALPDEDTAAILERRGMPRFTANTIDTPARLRRNLTAVRRTGYAVDNEEQAIGLRCLGATIHDEHGEPLAALSLSGPRARITDARLESLGALVVGASADITTVIGGVLPPWRAGARA